ncbi:unnamed protein product [Adineta steineri]|uniref:Uncharacterized protein n=1 Tax=Adineta steineri TaxID=433720 RepID=A0A818GRF6_9BILA|nr:unnamed protein product [Adineta steineri]CAF0983082.1 unnamed protein product [Adineta steineri]CAF1036881.1 unnamed protein product [Adineta steineri]CAF1181747.1 unnamed protein product [Adineta steineri]CAF3496049.1 unnamed protein product [Adineta steineri]
MNSVRKRPRDSYDQTDLQTHTARLNERINKHQLHNYGSAIDVYDAVARTLLPYWEYNERYKIKIFKQLRLDTSGIANVAHHVRAQLQTLHNDEKTSTITICSIDISNGASSVYLENCIHGRTLQILANILGIEIRLVTSYVYEEIISVIPTDLLEVQPLYIAFNDVSKQFFMLDKPANVKRDDLLQHQQTLDHLVQKYNLIPTIIPPSNTRCLSVFLCIAHILKSSAVDFLDTSALAIQIRDATYQQIKSNFDLYETYILPTLSNKSNEVDIRHDSQYLTESNYYRYQLERPILYALAHVLQCNLMIFSSASLQQQPEMIHADINNRSNANDQVIVLLKNESTQRFSSARTTYPLNHLFMRRESEHQLDPVYESIDHSPLFDPKNKTSSNTFFSKTKDKFVTAVNKLVDNYGNLPKKQTYMNTSQQRLTNTNNNNNEQTVPSLSNDHKPSGTKRQAPLAEHILRRQEETRQINHQTTDVTYENTGNCVPTPVPNRSSTSSSITTSAKNSQPSSPHKRQLRPVPYKDRQKTLTKMGTTKTTLNQNVFNGVTIEDVDESTTADEANNDDEYDSFSDEAGEGLQTVILRERKKKPILSSSNKLPRDYQPKKSTPYRFDRESLKRQQQSYTAADEDLYENDRQRGDDLNHEDDIYLSTSDIVQRDRKQLQLFVNGRTNNKSQSSSSSSSTQQQQQQQQHDRKLSTPKITSANGNSNSNDRQSFLIDKDAVLEVLGHNIAQRDRHILMKVLKQEDLVSKEWQRLLFLLDEYVNNPKKEKKERGLYALTLMENLDRLGYDMLEIQSTGANHFKAIAKSILLMIEINDWFSDHICRVLHLNGPTDVRMVRHLRKLCLREWSRNADDYRTLYAQHNNIQQQQQQQLQQQQLPPTPQQQQAQQQQQQRTALDLSREMERFRSEDYYRPDMCTLVNQALATGLAIPIHIVRAVREPNNPLEIFVPMRGTARPGLAIVLIASHSTTGDGHYDVAVLKGHPQTLRKHRNVTFDDKPEVRSFETTVDEQSQAALKTIALNNSSSLPQQQTSLMNPALMAAHQAQFFANPFMYTPFTFAPPQQQQQQQQQPQQQAPSSPSLIRGANNNMNNNNNQTKSNITGNANSTTPPTSMMLQPQMPFLQMQQAQPTFVYTPLMHTAQPPPATNTAATFFYTPANYPM